MGNLLSSLLEFLIRCFCRNSWKLCKDYKELNAFSKSKASKFPDLIPLEPIYHFLEVILIIFLIFIGTGLITVPVAIFSMDGVTTEFFFSISFFCLLLGLVLFPLFNIDSRYVLDMKHKQLLYVFSFLDYQRKKVVMPFSDILAIGVESHEAGSAGIVYRLEIANKNFKRLPICKNSYSYENLDEVAPMLAKALDCQFGLKEYPGRF